MQQRLPYSIALVTFVMAAALWLAYPRTALSFDAAYLAELLWQAKQRRDYLPDVYRLNPGLDDNDLYAVQRHYVARHLSDDADIAGYKGGFIPQAPVGGVLYRQGVLQGTAALALDDFTLLIVEAEIGFKFCKPVVAPLADVDALREAVCALIPVIEIADGAIADFSEVKSDFSHLRNVLISINVASSHTLLGSEYPTDIDLGRLAVTMRHNDVAVGRRDLSGPADLWENVRWVVNEFVLQNGYRISPGQFIIPGNLTGIHPAQQGSYTADFGPLGALRLTVE